MILAKIISFAFGGGVALVSLAAVGTAQAATFNNYADFQAATTSLTTIDFEGIIGGDRTDFFVDRPFVNINGATISGVTFSSGSPSRSPIEYDNSFVVFNTSNNEYNRGTGDILLGGSFNAALPPETTAFGFDLLTEGRFTQPTPYRIILSTGEFFDTSSSTFFGFTSATPISSISIRGAVFGVALDNFSFGQASSNTSPEPVPEPASILGTLAFAALGGKKLLKRKH